MDTPLHESLVATPSFSQAFVTITCKIRLDNLASHSSGEEMARELALAVGPAAARHGLRHRDWLPSREKTVPPIQIQVPTRRALPSPSGRPSSLCRSTGVAENEGLAQLEVLGKPRLYGGGSRHQFEWAGSAALAKFSRDKRNCRLWYSSSGVVAESDDTEGLAELVIGDMVKCNSTNSTCASVLSTSTILSQQTSPDPRATQKFDTWITKSDDDIVLYTYTK
jgi:hypothetical protein